MLSQAKSFTLFLTLTLALALVPKLAAQPPLEPEQLATLPSAQDGYANQSRHDDRVAHGESRRRACKGSPFCATVTSEHTQMFADGNRIHTTEDSSLCRDKEGRTRREAQLNLLGRFNKTRHRNSLLSSIQSPASVTRWIQAQKWLARCPFWRFTSNA